MTDTGVLLSGYSERQPALKESIMLPIETRTKRLGLTNSSNFGSMSTICPDDERDNSPASIYNLSECPPSPSHSPACQCEMPRRSELEEMFDALADGQMGTMGLPEIEHALCRLNSRYNLGLASDDARRLLGFLSASTSVEEEKIQAVTRQQFVKGVQDFASLLQRMSGKITLHQMKVFLSHAFVRFDVDGDNRISVAELAAAVFFMGVELSHRDVALLHRFLAPDTTGEIVQKALCQEPCPLEKMVSAAQRCCENLGGAELVAGAGHALQRAIHAWMAEKDEGKRPQRALDALWCEGEALEGAFQTAELALDVSGMLVAMQYMSDSFGDVLEAHAMQHGFNASAIATLLACLGVCGVNAARALDDLSVKEMNEDEALLFARLFQRHGFSQSEFCQMLSCPSCEWATAEPGEVLNKAGDQRLKILVRGSASVSIEGGHAVAMPAFSSIGETLFLRGRPLWTREVVAAVDRTVYVSWDPARLKEHLHNNDRLDLHASGLLSELMASNLDTLSRVRRNLEGASVEERYFERAVSGGGMEGATPQLQQVSSSELRLCLSNLRRRLGMKADGQEGQARLLAYIGATGLGVMVSCHEVEDRLRSLDASLSALEGAGLTLEELATVLSRSAKMVDSNGDGAISREEFAAALSRVCQMPQEHAGALFSYYASGDALIPVESFKTTFCSHSLVSALQSALHSEAERKGLARCTYFAQQVSEALQGEGSPMARVQRGLDAMCNGMESFAGTALTANDMVGVVSAFACVWQEFAGVASLEDVSDSCLAPFLVCFGMCSVHVARRLADSGVTDMEERESLLYSKAFEKHGWTMTEFRKLLKHSSVKWEHYEAGDVVSEGPCQMLRVVAKGSCEVRDSRRGVIREGLKQGAVKDQRNAGEGHVLRVTKAATIAAWDWEELESLLDQDQTLKQKLLRTVAASRADRLLETYHGDDATRPLAWASAA